MTALPITEAQIKLAVADYLTYKMNLGELYFDRLNSGEVIVVAGKSRRRIKLCREGTADFIVLMKKTFQFCHTIRPAREGETTAWFPYCKVIFLEVKSEKGKQRVEQSVFQKIVESFGARYIIIRSIEELAECLK